VFRTSPHPQARDEPRSIAPIHERQRRAIAFGRSLRDRKPKTTAFDIGAFDANEPTEYARQLLFRNARPLVDDLDLDRVYCFFHDDLDRAALRRVAQCVVDEVLQHAADFVSVSECDRCAMHL